MGIAFLGDMMLGRHVAPYVDAAGVRGLLTGIAPLTAGRSLVANLESPLTAGGGPASLLAARPGCAAMLADAGVAAVTIANNHAFDEGWPGVAQTISALSGAGVLHCGAGADRAEAAQSAVITAGGQRVALLGFCYSPPASRNTAGVAYLYDDTVQAAIRRARAESDFVVAMPHAGVELSRWPTFRDQRVYRDMIRHGANLVLGSHPHRVQVMEVFEGKPIYYGVGDCIFDSYLPGMWERFWIPPRHPASFGLEARHADSTTSLVVTLDFLDGQPVIDHHPVRATDGPAPAPLPDDERRAWLAAFERETHLFQHDPGVNQERARVQDLLFGELRARGLPCPE